MGERSLAVDRRTVALATGLALICLSAPASAQLFSQFESPNVSGYAIEPGVTVQSRLRPGYDYIGVQAGDFTIRPTLNESTGFDSNVFGTSRARGSSLVETVGSINVDSTNSLASINLGATVDDHRYPWLANQSFTNWSTMLGGSYNVGRDVLSFNYTHQNSNQTARDLDEPVLDHPIPFSLDDIKLNYRVNFSRLFIRPELETDIYNFANGTVAGQPYNQSYRDRVVFSPNVLIGYEVAPRRSVLAIIRDSVANYTNKTAGSPGLDYNDISLLTGVDYDTGGLVQLRALVGYEERKFSSSQFKSIAGPIAELSAFYNPSGLTTLTGTLTRHIQDSASEGTTGLTETATKLSVDHEYLRNVILHGESSFFYDEYGSGGGTQRLYELGASATWLLNRNMRVSGSYNFVLRGGGNSTVVLGSDSALFPGQILGGAYRDHIALLTVKFGL